MLEIWSLVPLPFLNPGWTFGSSQLTYCWSQAWRVLSITLLKCEKNCNCAVVWTSFGIALLWDWNENWPFPVLWPLLSFSCVLAYECSTFTASTFRIWNSSKFCFQCAFTAEWSNILCFHYSFICWWTVRLLSCLDYCKQCCNELWCACIFSKVLPLWFSPDICPEWDCWII